MSSSESIFAREWRPLKYSKETSGETFSAFFFGLNRTDCAGVAQIDTYLDSSP